MQKAGCIWASGLGSILTAGTSLMFGKQEGAIFDLVIIVIRFVARRRIYDGRFLVAHDQVMSAGRIGIPFCYAVYLLDPFSLPA